MPEDGNPIIGLSLLQLKIVPGEPEKLTNKSEPSQICWSEVGETVGVDDTAKFIVESLGQEPFVV